jgi:hypothetical protein
VSAFKSRKNQIGKETNTKADRAQAQAQKRATRARWRTRQNIND